MFNNMHTACTLVIALLVNSTSAFLFSSQAWNGLRAGFAINPFSSNTFAWLPRTVSEAVQNGWKLDNNVQCDRTAHYAGNRYIKDNDRAMMILFDNNGYVAGVQAGIPKSSNKTAYPAPNPYKAFNEESDMWVTTAYFVEPSTICSTGRAQDQFDKEGTGNMFAFQVGTNPNELMRIPMKQTEVLSKTKFVEGKCFYAMGVHYWYKLSKDLPCTEMFPAFLLYNGGKLNAFGWAFLPDFQTSQRWEHPSSAVASKFQVDTPTCVMETDHPGTTLHIYMTDSPRANLC